MVVLVHVLLHVLVHVHVLVRVLILVISCGVGGLSATMRHVRHIPYQKGGGDDEVGVKNTKRWRGGDTERQNFRQENMERWNHL